MTRTELLNMLIVMNGYKSYLEIGMQRAANNFDKINAPIKVSVDPDPKAEATFKCSSDDFFNPQHLNIEYKKEDINEPIPISGSIALNLAKEIPDTFKKVRVGQHNKRRRFIVSDKEDVDPIDITSFDLIFIDGLHHADQVERDIINSMAALNIGGMIILHDCNPKEEWQQLVPRQHKIWYGDVWRAFVGFRLKFPLVTTFCLDHDCGLGVIKYTKQKLESAAMNIQQGFSTNMSWQEFDKNRKQLLGII